MKPNRILAIVGPTASGKTPVALLLAERLRGEIVSADSRQIYKHINIGTAKPNPADLKKTPHYFIDLFDPSEDYSAGRYGQEAREVIHSIFKRGAFPILVGGSGFYIKATVDGLFEGAGKDFEIRSRLEQRMKNEGLDVLISELRRVDPLTLENMKEVTPRRVIRALEVFFVSGKPLSQFHGEQETKPDFEVTQVALEWERKELYERINRRVDDMIEAGLIEEAETLKKKGYDRQLNALNTVGYKEVFDYLEGLVSRDEMIRLIKQNTRRFAKRQMTWFRADKRIHWIKMTETKSLEKAATEIENIYKREKRSS